MIHSDSFFVRFCEYFLNSSEVQGPVHTEEVQSRLILHEHYHKPVGPRIAEHVLYVYKMQGVYMYVNLDIKVWNMDEQSGNALYSSYVHGWGASRNKHKHSISVLV